MPGLPPRPGIESPLPRLGCSAPPAHAVSAYDASGNLLAGVSARVDFWNDRDNLEGFWGIVADEPSIQAVTFLAPPGNYANVTELDNVEWTVSDAANLPEPVTLVGVVAGIGGLAGYVRKRGLRLTRS